MGDRLIVVTGAGGFIGGHLVADLVRQGHAVRAVDIKPLHEWYQVFDDVENVVADLSLKEPCVAVCRGADQVYQLAADMGGMGFIEHNKALCMLSVLTNTHMLQAALQTRAFDGSSIPRRPASTTPTSSATEAVVPLKEEDAYPAMPEDGYGWEKLFSERMCRHFREDFGLTTRIARYHNVYGPHGTWEGGREKAPAAICRKVIEAKHQRHPTRSRSGATASRPARSCTSTTASRAPRRSWRSDIEEPINLGSSELVTINQLVDMVEDIAGVRLRARVRLDRAQGRQRAELGQHPHPGATSAGSRASA